MQALLFHGPRQVRCETVPDPAPGHPGDAVVAVRATAVCGSDLHVYRGHEQGLDHGTVLGHEFAGEVVAAGRDVRGFAPGDRVFAPFTTSCGTCFYCTRGLTCRCESGALFGWIAGGRGLHGAQAGFVRVPLADSTLVAAPEDVSWEQALLCGDVLATGLFCAELGAVAAGDTVAVIGLGAVGVLATAAARLSSAARVFAVDRVSERLALAARFGGEPVDLARQDPVDVVRSATAGRGADVVLEAVGNAAATRLAIDLVRPGGTIAACGVHNEPSFAFAPGEAYDRNLTYRAGRCPSRAFAERALSCVRDVRLPWTEVFSHRWPLSRGPEAYALFESASDGCTKVLLRP